MEELDLIKMAHAIDAKLGELAGSVKDEALRERVQGIRTSWKEVAYAVTADLCGLAEIETSRAPKRRGRRKRAEVSAEPSDAGAEMLEGSDA